MKIDYKRMIKLNGLLFLALTTFLWLGSAHAQKQLEPVDTPDFDELYLASSFSVPLSKKIYIEDVPVTFSNDWLRKFRTATNKRYQERTKEKYGSTLKELLAQDLEKLGWEVVNKKQAGVLIASPSIVELDIYAPNETGIRHVIVRNSGRAGIELVFKTAEGQPFMKIVDIRQTRESIGSPVVANRSNNYRYFKMLMELWSERSALYLEQVMGLVEQQQKNK